MPDAEHTIGVKTIEPVSLTEVGEKALLDPHIVYLHVVRAILNDAAAPGLSVLDLKALVERVFTSGEVFPGEDDDTHATVDPRLDFQPIMATLSDTMRQTLHTEVVSIGDRFYSLSALAAKLHTSEERIRERLQGKTSVQLDVDMKAILDKGNGKEYKSELTKTVINPVISATGAQVREALVSYPPQTYSIDLTTISQPYPQRSLTNVEVRYLQVVRDVALSSQQGADGNIYPVGLSETYLYDMWNGLLSQVGKSYTPLVDFDPVIAALSPGMKQVTGTSLVPRMQLYADSAIAPLPLVTTLPNAPQGVMELLEQYDNLQTEETIRNILRRK